MGEVDIVPAAIAGAEPAPLTTSSANCISLRLKPMRVNVNLIRAFEGPRHARLEGIWAKLAQLHPVNMLVFDNSGARLSHAECLNRMWVEEMGRPDRFAVFTELDFLPYDGWLDASDLDHEEPVAATRYCTRDPRTMRLVRHPYPGAWFVIVDKRALGERQPARPFAPVGPHNDPANGLKDALAEAGAGCRLIEVEDCMPEHYGCEVRGRGQHLFWSRHYNDPPTARAAGFSLGDVQGKVDVAISVYESSL